MNVTDTLTSDLNIGNLPSINIKHSHSASRTTRGWTGYSPWVDVIFPLEENMSFLSAEITSPGVTTEFSPRTPLGKRLLSLRLRAIEAGMRLLSADEILEEVRRRRGEIEDNEADLR